MKKCAALILALMLSLTALAGCGEKEEPIRSIPYDITAIAPDATAATINGREIPAQIYFYWLGYSCSYVEYQINTLHSYYGAYSELIQEDGSIDWSGELEGQPVTEFAKDQAVSMISYYAAIEALAEEQGIALTQADQDAVTADLSSAVEELGGEEQFADYLYQTGLTRDGFLRITSNSYLYQRLLEQVGQEGSYFYLDPADYGQYRMCADHILLLTTDQATGAALPDDEIAAKRATAEDLLALLRASGDPQTLFAQLADQYSEDPGRASNPNGYIFSSGEMVQAFEDTAAQLAPGEISDIIETEYGYHILLGKDLEAALAEDTTGILNTIRTEHLDRLLGAYGHEHPLEITDEADAVDAGSYYTQLTAAMNAAKAAQQDAEGGASDGDSAASEGEGDSGSGTTAS